jgi:hypothetical protein
VRYFSKKLLVSIFSLLFFFTIFGTVTYAWFSLAKFNQLSNLNIELVTGKEFQISLDGINFHNEISTTEIEHFIGSKAKLSDITSTDGKNFIFGKLKEDEGIPEANTDYLSFPLYFRTTRKQKFVYLVNNVSSLVQYDMVRKGTYAVSKGILWTADNTFQNGLEADNLIRTGEKYLLNASDAIRIAVIEEQIENNIFDNRDSNDLLSKIFDLSGNPDRGYGAPFGGISYFNKKHRIQLDPPTEIPTTVYKLTEFDDTNPYLPLNRNSEILEMIQTIEIDEYGNSYSIGKVIINIWLEGWDADCFNAIYSDSLRIQLEFRSGSPTNYTLKQVIN